jgi:hypothetical protein
LSIDPGLLILELAALVCVLWVGPRRAAFRARRRQGYDDFVLFCQTNALSLTEIGALATLSLGLVGFDFFLAFVEDDLTEIFGSLVLGLAIGGGLGLVVALDIQYFYTISALGGGNALLVAFNDLTANALCVLRIVLCWVRYLFYDFQVEALDWAFHYLEGGSEYALGSWGGGSRQQGSLSGGF